MSATKTTAPTTLPSVARARKRAKPASETPWPEKTPASTSALPTTQWCRWAMPIAVVTSATMKIWPMVSREAETSQERSPISHPASTPESAITHAGWSVRPCAILPNAQGSATPSAGATQLARAAKAVVPRRLAT